MTELYIHYRYNREKYSNSHVKVRGDLLAYNAPSGPAVAGFDLQGAGHSLPHVGLTLPNVQHRDVHEGHLNCTIRPQLDVIHGTLV